MNKLNNVLFKEKEETYTSKWVDVSLMKRISLQMAATSVVSGNGKFEVEVSNDGGTTISSFQRLITNVTGETVADSVTLNSNSNTIITLPKDFVAILLRVKVTITTDGKYTAIIAGN